MQIENNILRHYLRDAYFITGTAYAGKSTAVHLLAERFGMVECGENFTKPVTDIVADEKCQPNLSYFKRMKDWKEFAEIISRSQGRKVIVDTNLPLHVLHEISDYDHVAVMVCPQSMSVDRFFDRSDPDKQFLLSVIDSCENRDEVMKNYRRILERINSKENYDELVGSGFFTLARENDGRDTREEVLMKLAEHFKLI